FIYVGWLIAGVVIFTIYRRHRQKSLWQPLAAPPPRHVLRHKPAYERVGDSYAARVHVGRRRLKAAAHAPARTPSPSGSERTMRLLYGMRNPRRLLAAGLAVAGLGVVALAIVVDLSGLDPFGPRLDWSPGVIVMAALVAFLLFHRRGH